MNLNLRKSSKSAEGLLLALLLLFVLAAPAHAQRSITVSTSTALRTAFEKAEKGDVIRVVPKLDGGVRRPLTIDKPLVLRGVSGIVVDATYGATIQGAQLTIIDSDNVNLRGLRLLHHGGRDIDDVVASIIRHDGYEGRCLSIDDSRDVTVTHCTFGLATDDCVSISGDTSRRITIEHCLFGYCLAGIASKGLLAAGSATPDDPPGEYVKLQRSVFAGPAYRTPKLDCAAGPCLVYQNVITGFLYPAELQNADVTLAGNWLAPDARMLQRPFATVPTTVRYLADFANVWRRGGRAREGPVVGYPGHVADDPRNTVPADGAIGPLFGEMDEAGARRVIDGSGAPDPHWLDDLARRSARKALFGGRL